MNPNSHPKHFEVFKESRAYLLLSHVLTPLPWFCFYSQKPPPIDSFHRGLTQTEKSAAGVDECQAVCPTAKLHVPLLEFQPRRRLHKLRVGQKQLEGVIGRRWGLPNKTSSLITLDPKSSGVRTQRLNMNLLSSTYSFLLFVYARGGPIYEIQLQIPRPLYLSRPVPSR